MQNRIIRLRKGRKGKLKPGHPWIFKGAILKVDNGVKPGDIITVLDNEEKFVGRGYYNPASSIAIRLLTFHDEAIDEAFLRRRIKESVDKRAHFDGITNAKRLIFSEADGLPGLIVDQYNDTLVAQVFTLGMEAMKEGALKLIADTVNPKYIYEKSDSPFRKLEGLKGIKKWWLYEGPNEVEIYEGKAKYIVDFVNGHKTGFYLDQRRSRLSLGAISKDKTVLDLFCYTGGFSISAGIGGARKVLGADIKEEWLALARRNAELNGISDRAEFKKGDAFEILKNVCNSGEKFDIIVLDPPSFAKGRDSIVMAKRGYKELNLLAMRSLNEGGILCTFSCSHNMTNDLFAGVIKDAAREAGRSMTIVKRCHQDKDHPFTKAIPETEYLKGYFLKNEKEGVR